VSLRLPGFAASLACVLVLTACGGTSGTNPPPPPPENFQLTVALTGTGTVTSSPAGINCPTTCTASFTSGTSVTLTATAGSGFQFSGYSDACSGTSCQITLASDQSVSATFATTSTNSAQVTVNVSGQGTVTSSPAGINCPSTCSASFDNGTTVTLTATPASGSTFSGFTGDCSGSTCQLAISNNQNVSVDAAFAQMAHDIKAIKHIIIVTQENRSFDHYFGHLPDYWQSHNFPQATNGTTFEAEPTTSSDADPTGSVINPYNLQTACTENPSPSWAESHRDRNRFNPEDSNHAPMDGFVITAANDAQQASPSLYDVLGHRAMGYFTGDQLNYYYFMASNFATSDQWFAPIMSRTQLNRMYLYGATSQGHVSPLKANEHLTSKTIIQLMQDNGISWKIYVHPDASHCTDPSCLAKYSYLKQFNYGSVALSNFPNNFASTSQLMDDMQNGNLPQVSFLEPAGYVGLDEHSNDTDIVHPPSLQSGAKYIEGIINTLMASTSWKDTVLILTYDEPGGFYDHVPPQSAVPPDAIQFPTDGSTQSGTACANDSTDPICGFFFTGFRVPVIVVSPFSKKNYVSHQPMDYTAMLKLIETRFNLPSLTARDAAQPDMTDFFDFVNVPWATPPSDIPTQDQSMQCVLESLSGITVSPNPAPAGASATVTLNLSKAAIQDVTVSLSADQPGVVPPSAVIANTTSSTSFNITVPTGITSLTITGSIGGIPVSGTVPVQ
jgi:phospholipase C